MPPSALEKRLTKVEDALEKHLLESGEIRTKLDFLVKAFWILITLCATDIAARLLHR